MKTFIKSLDSKTCPFCRQPVTELFRLIAVDRPIYINLYTHEECYAKTTAAVIEDYLKELVK